MPFPKLSTLYAVCLAAGLSTYASSCSNENPAAQGSVLPACARNDALAVRLGCAPLDVVCEPPPPACAPLADAWFTCVERDLRQCICEEDDGQLNCEGSYKPDEGPAHCVEQYRAFDDCLGDEGEDE
jgi:hypothetical protein